MIRTRRDFIQAGLAAAGATGLMLAKTAAYASGTYFELAASPANSVKDTTMPPQQATVDVLGDKGV